MTQVKGTEQTPVQGKQSRWTNKWSKDKMADNTRSRSKSEEANADATESQSIPLWFIKELLSVQESSMKSFLVRTWIPPTSGLTIW